MIREPPAFFHRGPSPLARLTFFTLAAIALMIADHRFHALETVRLSLSVLAHPLQQAATMPGEAVSRVAEYFASQQRLLRENQDLKAQVLEQSAAAQEARLLKAEEAHLLGMTGGKSRYVDSGIIAEVLYTARYPFTRKIVVDMGLTHSVGSGMPAIDGTYPPGLVVAEVTSVQKNAAYVFAKISAKPAAGVDNHRYVMLLPLPAPAAARPETKAEEQPRRGSKERTRARRPP